MRSRERAAGNQSDLNAAHGTDSIMSGSQMPNRALPNDFTSVGADLSAFEMTDNELREELAQRQVAGQGNRAASPAGASIGSPRSFSDMQSSHSQGAAVDQEQQSPSKRQKTTDENAEGKFSDSESVKQRRKSAGSNSSDDMSSDSDSSSSGS